MMKYRERPLKRRLLSGLGTTLLFAGVVSWAVFGFSFWACLLLIGSFSSTFGAVTGSAGTSVELFVEGSLALIEGCFVVLEALLTACLSLFEGISL